MSTDDKHALWMPENSVRALLAFMLTTATIAAVLKQIPAEYVAMLSGFTGWALGDYFGKRSGESHPQE